MRNQVQIEKRRCLQSANTRNSNDASFDLTYIQVEHFKLCTLHSSSLLHNLKISQVATYATRPL